MDRARLWTTLLVLICTAAPASLGQGGLLDWVNQLRQGNGLPPLESDELLAGTAQAWSRHLAEAGVLSHLGADGSSVLDRYRAAGGTDVRVGEILGAGRNLGEIERAWARSDPHRQLILEPFWTHAGWGSSTTAGGPVVWVVVFCQRLVKDLSLTQANGSLVITGVFTTAAAAVPELSVGLSSVPPSSWDGTPAFRFEFKVTRPEPDAYVRLGYWDKAGTFVLTNAFTLRPGTESPAGQARSEAPGASP